MDTRHVVARFETEREALALMDHPSIATVFDAGETHSGRPYFVMGTLRVCRSRTTAIGITSEHASGWRSFFRCAVPSSMHTRRA